jgi:cytosine/adenosine deaminase-related metal-dependent hydrolase
MDLRNIAPENIEQGIQEGLQELRQEGVVGVVDVGNTGRALPYLRDSGLYGLFLLELINFDPEAAEKVFEEGRAFLNRLQCGDVETQKQGKSHDVPASPRSRASASQHIATGLTGHAIYSCSEPLLRKIAAYAVQTNTPISLHLLESLEERALIEGGGGFFATFLRQLGYSLDAWKAPEISSLFYAERCLGTKARRLYVHLVHIREEELHYLASQPDTFIALCPKSNLFMGEPLPPIDRIGAVHPNITIGTDSLASNNRLSILEELRTIQLAFPLISSETLIRWATLNGARYLGLEGMLGSFTPRKQPGILAIYTSQLEPDTFLMGRDLSLIPICPEPQN